MILNFFKSSYSKIKNALNRAGSLLGSKIRGVFKGKIDDETFDELERILYEADLGVKTAVELTEKLRESPQLTENEYIDLIKKEIMKMMGEQRTKLREINESEAPMIILIVGVNGNGKTTTVAKLAKRFQDSGKHVLIGAADTFRAAAIDQLAIWAKKIGADIVKGSPNSDPAAVTFDAVEAAKARKTPVVIIDTAGRLHTRKDLMQELEKIKRSCNKVHPNSPHETLLVLDSTIGQNAIDQAKTFHSITPISGLILTKLDGSSKGGIVVNIQRELGIPVKFIGIGENLDDLEPFDPETFINSLLD